MERSRHLIKAIIFCSAFLCSGNYYSQACIANFNPVVGSNGVVTFNNLSTSTSSVVSYFWTFSGIAPGTSTVQHPVLTYTNAGVYSATLVIVTSAPGCTNTSVKSFTILPSCSATTSVIPASNSVTCNGSASVTSANVCGAAAYTWVPGNIVGNPASGLCAGVYTVYIASSGSVANCCSFITHTVHVPACSVAASFSYVPGPNGVIHFVNTTTGGVVSSSSWNFGDNSFSIASNPTHTFSANGNYLVKLLVNAGPNCKDSVFVPVTVSSYTCNAAFSYSLHPGGNVTFTSTSQPPSTLTAFSWNFGNGNTVSGVGIFTVSNTYTSNASYSVVLSVTIAGCTSIFSDTVKITNIPLPCTLQSGFSHSVAAGGIVHFYSTSTGTTANTSYTWASGANQFSTGSPTVSFTYTTAGTFVANLSVSENNCFSTYYDTITVPAFSCNLVASFGHTVGSLGYVSFKSTSIGAGAGALYNWSFGDGTSGTGANTFHSYTNGGSHLVRLIVSSANCIDTTILSVNITGISCVANSGFTLQPSGTPHYWHAIPAYPWNVVAARWSWGDGSTSSGLYVSHQYSVSSTYNICLSTTVSCGDTSTHCSSYYVYRSSASNPANTVYHVNVVPPQIKALGLASYEGMHALQLYPNPNRGTFTIKSAEVKEGALTMRMRDLIGSEVFVKEIVSLQHDEDIKVDASLLRDGIYFVELQDGDRRYLQKMIITR